MSSRTWPILAADALIVLGWVLVAVMNPDRIPPPLEYPIIGILIGTPFGQAVLAGAWAGLGPLPLGIRLPLSLIWLAILPLALWINEPDVVLMLGVSLLGMWIVSFVCCASLAAFYRFSASDKPLDEREGRKPLQFGIRQLMLLTAIVAVLLAIGRLIVPALAAEVRDTDELLIFGLLGLAAILTNLPLVLAALLPTRMLPAIGMSLLLGIFWTIIESQLVQITYPAPAEPNLSRLIWINLFGAAWALAVPLLMRLGGYRLRAV